MLRVLEDNWVETEYPVGVVNWTNEEGARFPGAMMSSGVWSTVEKFCDDGVVNVFFLFPQEFGADRIEGVASKLMVPLNQLKKIELNSAVRVR